jgi:hypothetical protein
MIFAWGKIIPDELKSNLSTRSGYLSLRIEEIPKFENVDILFLGASSAYRSFDTRLYEELGYKAFNLGSSSQSPIQTNILLKRYIETLNPKLIIYDVSQQIFNSDGVESSVDLIINDRNDINSIKMAVMLKNIKPINTLIYVLIDDLFNGNRAVKIKKRQKEDNYISGGFVEKDLAFYKGDGIPQIQKYSLKDEQLKAFIKTLKIIRENDIKLILVQTPIIKSEYEAYTNNAEFDQKMIEYGEYYNFNEVIELNDTVDFYDAHHMNQNGVILFNEKLINILGLRKKPTHNTPPEKI